MKNRLILFLLAFFVWILLNWVPDWQHLLAGVGVSFLVAFLSGDLFPVSATVFKTPQRFWYFLVYYLPLFGWECFKANLDVAWRVLHPALPIKPGIVKVSTRLKSDTALTFLANSITLTPGTLTVDINKEQGVLYVHCIEVKTKDDISAALILAERFEKILVRVFESV